MNGRWDTSKGVARSLYNVNYGPLNGSAEEIARRYLSENSQMFKMQRELTDLKAVKVQSSPAGNHVRFEQYYKGLPIYKSDVVVSVNKSNYVTFISSNYKQNIFIENVTPVLTNLQAIDIVKKSLQVTGKILSKEESILMIYAEDNEPRLSYRVTFSSSKPRGSWEAFVDAQSGELFHLNDLRVFEVTKNGGLGGKKKTLTNGTGYIYDPDPLTTANVFYGTAGYTDNNNSVSTQLNNQRILVTLRDITEEGGWYELIGPYVSIVDWDEPYVVPVSRTHPDSFRFTRDHSGFEDVNVYYHIDQSQRYIQELGFTDIQNLSIMADPHGADGEDNAYYDPNVNGLSFGDGGVDDGEDADVILHEYGHAIQWGIVPGWGGYGQGNEEGALGEGFGDYWAGSYSRAVNPSFSRNFVFTWDAGFNGTSGTIWSGRPLNFALSYPTNGVSNIEVHDAGRYWSAVLMLIWDNLGREVTDRIVLQSHYYLSTYATMRDNAEAVLQADRDLYGGVHINQIGAIFEQRNFLPPPTIAHRVLKDTENLNGPYPVTAIVTCGYYPITSVKVIYGRNYNFTDSAVLAFTGNPNEYKGYIKGNGEATQYRYYIQAQTSIGTITKYPPNAPTGYFSFFARIDTVLPIAKHEPIYDPAKVLWPPKVKVIADDNLEVDSVWIEFLRQRENLAGSFPIARVNDTTYEATFGLSSSEIAIGDSVFYAVFVKDKATVSNILKLPVSGFYKFKVSKIKVLVGTQYSSSASLIYNTLRAKEYVVDSLKLSLVASSDIPKYDLVIMTGGTNQYPLFGRRLDIISRVRNGGKVLVEGGNVGAFYVDADVTFRRVVLHDSTWLGDVIGSDLIITNTSHPIFNTPNQINSPINFTTTTEAADRDAVLLIPGDPGVVSIATWSGCPSSSATIVYTQPGSSYPTTIFFPFALSSITDTNVAKNLVENAVVSFFPPEGTSDVESETKRLPTSFLLENNYPNPFNPHTTVTFNLPTDCHVKLTIYDILGRDVECLYEGKKERGQHKVVFSAVNLSSGIYFYKLEAIPLNKLDKPFIKTNKMILIK